MSRRRDNYKYRDAFVDVTYIHTYIDNKYVRSIRLFDSIFIFVRNIDIVNVKRCDE